MIGNVGDIHEQDIVHEFEHNMEKFKITRHTTKAYCERYANVEESDEDIDHTINNIVSEFKKAEEVKRYKSAISALKYGELSFYHIYKPHGEKGDHGNIYVVNGDNVIKTIYLSKHCGWYEKYLINSKMGRRRKYKYADRGLRGTRRESVNKDKKE